MNNISAHVWICYLATLGVVLACVGYCIVRPNNDAAQQFVFQIANSLISGALGAFTAMSKSSATAISENPQQPGGPAPLATLTTETK